MKIIIISILAVAVVAGGAMLVISGASNSSSQTVDNVSMVGGKQIITISAKGGYSPRLTNAKAGVPTVIKMNTQGTFDCSSAIVIPSLGYRSNLPPSGETLIDVPPQNAGTALQGLCSMGMYSFSINFN
ncbi:MAG TPA: cupredoxin domain-containing protein [Negativicutes bacterium]|nr:MAG: hypothetical protein A3C50_01845 [Candidatus Staskawiczbacteria bacterium RIFCSPHIGHO2_02_FULL_43_16]OGZ74454.1 MAG: hypothetical protein A3A12_01645 [Candidatus Staskawiczbacteria bacterium RIFCSPLOWO2_01_FULL_43_17b]HLD70738.1 cupredoxin domain-containing protein [Negativicutes bacterium]